MHWRMPVFATGKENDDADFAYALPGRSDRPGSETGSDTTEARCGTTVSWLLW